MRDSDRLLSAACAAADYDERMLTENNAAPGCTQSNDQADVVDLEDARLRKDMADLRQSIAQAKEDADAQRRTIDAIYASLRARGAHIRLVSNDVDSGDSPNTR